MGGAQKIPCCCGLKKENNMLILIIMRLKGHRKMENKLVPQKKH